MKKTLIVLAIALQLFTGYFAFLRFSDAHTRATTDEEDVHKMCLAMNSPQAICWCYDMYGLDCLNGRSER